MVATKTKTQPMPGLDQLDAVRQTICDKESRLNEIHRTSITKREARDRIDRSIAKATTVIKDRYFKQISFLHPNSKDADLTGPLERLTPLELEIWLHGEQLKDQLRLVVDEHFERHAASNGSGLSASDRAAQTAALEAELGSLYVKEEEVFVELKGAGLEPIRRGGEDPTIVYEVQSPPKDAA